MSDDAELARAVRQALEWDVRIPDWSIQSTVSAGAVTLSGIVKYETQRADAERAVEQVAGVTRVFNQIEVRAPRAAPQAGMKIRDLMTGDDLLTITEQDSLAVAAHRMSWKRCRHLPVVRGGRVVGVISDRDVFGWVVDGHRLEAPGAVVGAVMGSPPLVAAPDEDIGEVAARMISWRIGAVPVVVDGALVGIVTRGDLLGRIVAEMYTPALEFG